MSVPKCSAVRSTNETEYPTLLEPPGPRLLAYPHETAISEKLEAMVKLGIANSRMKDFHDLHSLATTFAFDGKTLTAAVRATFKRRGTELPAGGVPLAFTPEFYEDENKIKQWNAFCNKNKSYVQQTEFRDILVASHRSWSLSSRPYNRKGPWTARGRPPTRGTPLHAPSTTVS